jgi:hypothetical protein
MGPVRVRGGPERRTGPEEWIIVCFAYVINENTDIFWGVYHKSSLLGFKSKKHLNLPMYKYR